MLNVKLDQGVGPLSLLLLLLFIFLYITIILLRYIEVNIIALFE